MDRETINVMKHFPNVKLSYEEKVYKKVYCKFDYYSAIPYGKNILLGLKHSITKIIYIYGT